MDYGLTKGNGRHPCSSLRLLLILTIILFQYVRCEFRLSIIHNNDFHSHYLPIKNGNNADCYENYETNPECVAGVARTVAKVKELRAKAKDQNILFLNAGDHFQGTAWYTVMRSKVVSLFVNLMKHDVMALGNHEFDDGPEELVKFIESVTNPEGSNLPIVCSNIVVDPSSPIHGMFTKSIVLNLNGTKVAIIGYITTTTTATSNPGKLIQFRDEIVSIQEEISMLKTKHTDLKIFIGLGHSGYDRDLQIAQAINDLDLIVGGHSHTFLYSSHNGSRPPSSEIPKGPYPTVYKRRTKESLFLRTKPTLVVQAFAFGKYLGYLDIVFDDNGEIIKYNGSPILLDHQTATDPETRQLVKKLHGEMAAELNKTYGIAEDELSIADCRHKECAIGNLIAESFVEYFNHNGKRPISSQCDLIAVINGGNIRTSIDKGPITYGQIVSTLPFRNSLGVLTINGSNLIKIYKHSAQQHDLGGFLQQSDSIRARYRLHKTKTVVKKSTLVDLKVRCQNKWIMVKEDGTIYSIIINNFLANQGDFYPINIKDWHDSGFSDSDLLTDYIKKHRKIRAKLDDRIMITNSASALRSRFFYPLTFLFVLAILIIIMFIMEK